jgi:hypothetical protein
MKKRGYEMSYIMSYNRDLTITQTKQTCVNNRQWKRTGHDQKCHEHTYCTNNHYDHHHPVTNETSNDRRLLQANNNENESNNMMKTCANKTRKHKTLPRHDQECHEHNHGHQDHHEQRHPAANKQKVSTSFSKMKKTRK